MFFILTICTLIITKFHTFEILYKNCIKTAHSLSKTEMMVVSFSYKFYITQCKVSAIKKNTVRIF